MWITESLIFAILYVDVSPSEPPTVLPTNAFPSVESINSYMYDERMLQFLAQLAEMHVTPQSVTLKQLTRYWMTRRLRMRAGQIGTKTSQQQWPLGVEF